MGEQCSSYHCARLAYFSNDVGQVSSDGGQLPNIHMLEVYAWCRVIKCGQKELSCKLYYLLEMMGSSENDTVSLTVVIEAS